MKNEKRKWKSNFIYLLQRKTNNETKICVSFFYIIEIGSVTKGDEAMENSLDTSIGCRTEMVRHYDSHK